MSVSDHAQYQSPGSGSPQYTAVIIDVINSTYMYAFLLPALTSQNVHHEKGQFYWNYLNYCI